MQVQYNYKATIPTGFTIGEWYTVVRRCSDGYRVYDDEGVESLIYLSEVSEVKYD